jgi:hypothetical protein
MALPSKKLSGLRSPITIDDLAADLIWPRLLRAGPIAFSPIRLGLGLFAVISIALVIGVCLWLERALHISDPALLNAGVPEAARHFTLSSLAHHPGGAAWRLTEHFITLPWLFVLSNPITATAGVIVSLCLWAIAGGAISRTAAEEFATGRTIPWPAAIGLALSHLRSLIAAVAGPVILVWSLWMVLAFGGFVLFRLPGLDLLGGVLYGLALLLGFFAILLMGAFALAHWMLIPAVVCEGTDAIDAVQRAYAYVFGRTSRLLLYGLIITAQGLLLGWIVWFLAAGASGFAARAAATWAGPKGRAVIESGSTHTSPTPLPSSTSTVSLPSGSAAAPPHTESPSSLGPTRSASAFLVGVWSWIPTAFPFAFGVSFVFTGSTLLYLACRRINDGQDMQELWTPDQTGAVSRGSIIEAAPSPPSPPDPDSSQVGK